jgi:HPr kinase/phosphorylase
MIKKSPLHKDSVLDACIPGGLLRVYHVGVLITGDSGIGKSESALELISRGHHFVSDDVTIVRKKRDGQIVGSAPELSRYFMEIRGLGIINIKEIFTHKAICEKTEIHLVVELNKWEKGREYDRLGLEFEEDRVILDKKIPKISIPVAPGRNMATLIEVACKVHILKKKGYHAPQDITKKLDKVLNSKNDWKHDRHKR